MGDFTEGIQRGGSLKIIARDILYDMQIKERLYSGKGNAMLVAAGIPEACRYYRIFRETLGDQCAIVTSYEPNTSDIKGEESGKERPRIS